MKYKQKAYSREKRKEQIILQFSIWYEKGDTEPKTMTRIARALDMTPSEHVRDLLLELVEEGKLTWQVREKSGRWAARAFQLSEALVSYHEKFSRRTIKVQKRGVAVGQLEMFS